MTSVHAYTTEQAAEILGVPAQLIAQWKHRGRVQVVDEIPGRGPRVPLYRLDDLRPLAEAYLARKEARTRRAGTAGLASGPG